MSHSERSEKSRGRWQNVLSSSLTGYRSDRAVEAAGRVSPLWQATTTVLVNGPASAGEDRKCRAKPVGLPAPIRADRRAISRCARNDRRSQSPSFPAIAERPACLPNNKAGSAIAVFMPAGRTSVYSVLVSRKESKLGKLRSAGRFPSVCRYASSSKTIHTMRGPWAFDRAGRLARISCGPGCQKAHRNSCTPEMTAKMPRPANTALPNCTIVVGARQLQGEQESNTTAAAPISICRPVPKSNGSRKAFRRNSRSGMATATRIFPARQKGAPQRRKHQRCEHGNNCNVEYICPGYPGQRHGGMQAGDSRCGEF